MQPAQLFLVDLAHAGPLDCIHEAHALRDRIASDVSGTAARRDQFDDLRFGHMAFLAASDDIALIRLATAAKDVQPVALYRGAAEVAQIAALIGKGATGNGVVGLVPGGPHRTTLRRAYNALTGGNDRYLGYRFDPPPQALPPEGVLGNGDSGGPLVIDDHGTPQLVGLGSWITAVPEHALEAGFYGQVVYNVRVSRDIDWIESISRDASH